MGRRGAPQPLRLSDPTAATTLTTTTTAAAAAATLNTADTNLSSNLNSASSSQHRHHLPSPSNDLLNSSTTATAASSTAGASPIDSRSPGSSPRVSPFTSRFSTRRPQTSRAASDERSHTLHSDSHTPPLPDHRPDPSYPSITSAVDAGPLSAPATGSRQPPPEGGSRLQKAQTEHSKKFSRAGFFHFAKSSKANNSLQGSASSSVSDRRNRSISRGKDGSEASSRAGMFLHRVFSPPQTLAHCRHGLA